MHQNMRASGTNASSVLTAAIFLASLIVQHHAFTISSPGVSQKILLRKVTKLPSTPDSEDIEDPNPDLDQSQLEWLQKRSEKMQQDQISQERYEASQEQAERISGNVNIPKTGISVSDDMNELQSDEKFIMKLFPLQRNGAAAIQTVTTSTASDEPMRYLVPLGDYGDDADSTESTSEEKKYAMIDLPPFSKDLEKQMKSFMGENGKLSHILITCRSGIHYDQSPAVYVTRKSDMQAWKSAFPTTNIIMYRLDISRDFKKVVTQSLDGYGPWALDAESGKFNETGRPLTVMEWDEDVQASVLDEGESPPDDEDQELDDAELYTPKAIKEREEGKDILAIYTPGHTYGSMSYIFPQSKLCCSGFTIPVEDTRAGASAVGLPKGAGPKLEYSGYLTTSSSLDRQIESARHLANVYNDRFEVVLPSRGPPVSLDTFTAAERSRILHDMLNEFAELGRVYGSLGII